VPREGGSYAPRSTDDDTRRTVVPVVFFRLDGEHPDMVTVLGVLVAAFVGYHIGGSSTGVAFGRRSARPESDTAHNSTVR